MGDFNAQIGMETWKGVIGKHGVSGLNENGRKLLMLCFINVLSHHEYLFSAQRCS